MCDNKRISVIVTHFICTCPFCFALTWRLSATSISLYVSSNEPGIKYETSGVMYHFAPESKIQLVNCKLSPKLSLGHSSLPYICAINAYIFWSLLFLLLLYAQLTFSLKRTWFCRFSFYFGGFVNFAISWSSDLHIKHFQGVCSVRLLYEWPDARNFSFSVLILLRHCSTEWLSPPQKVRFVWTVFAISLFIPQTELLSRFR